MNLSLPYLVEVSICMGLFYLLYVVSLRRYTFFAANRFYLLSGMVLSFIIPFLSIPVFKPTYNFVFKTVDGLPAGYVAQVLNGPDELIRQSVFTLPNLLWVIYSSVVLVLLVRLLFSIRKITGLVRTGSSEKREGYTIVRLSDVQPFSFAKWIFLPYGHIDPLIIEHERLHVKDLHWVDLIVAEIVKSVLWFNPVIYWYKKALQLQHEYIADRGALRSHGRMEDYMLAVMTQLRSNTMPIPVNRFHSLSIKKRILMMTKKQTSRSRALWYAVSLPIVAMTLFSFAFTTKKKTPAKTQLNIPAPFVPPATDHVPHLFPVDVAAVETVIGYGERRHPLFGKMMMHTGLDFTIAEGSKIMSTADGFVLEAGFNSAHGNYVIVKHGETYQTKYSHMKEFTVKQGQNVKAGETIGYVGNTGLSTGPHLHYEVYQRNKQVDPKKFMPELGC